MLTHLKSTMRVLHMPMHLSSGHVTLLPGKFNPPQFSLQSNLGRWADSRWALPQISSCFLVRLKAIACGADLCFTPNVFFLHSRNLRDAWADRREILHDGQK